jgi:sec-independent protein translocase protein TatC
VIVGAFILGAIFTPPDVISQIMLAVPLWLLYEAGILVASMLSKPAKAEEAESYRPMDDDEMERELDAIEAKKDKPE